MADINQRITHQTEKYQWEFMFLGANQDAIATAARMGIHAHHAATFAVNEDDLHASTSTFAKRISTSRKYASLCSLNEEEAAIMKEHMEETLDKSRKEMK